MPFLGSRIAPRDLHFRIEVAHVYWRALADVFRRKEGERDMLERSIRDAAIESLKRLRRDDIYWEDGRPKKTGDKRRWGSVLFTSLNEGMKHLKDDRGEGQKPLAKGIRQGCHEALEALRADRVDTPPAGGTPA